MSGSAMARVMMESMPSPGQTWIKRSLTVRGREEKGVTGDRQGFSIWIRTLNFLPPPVHRVRVVRVRERTRVPEAVTTVVQECSGTRDI